MGEYLLGIDIGGTAIKVSLYTANGVELATSLKKTPLLIPRAGFHERDMNTLWDTTAMVIRGTLEKAEVDGSSIACIGCTGHGKGLYLWGINDNPCYNAIASSDSRAVEYVEGWNRGEITDKLSAFTLQTPLACQPAALLRWLKDNEPEVYGKIKHIFSAKDYIRFMLTGQPFSDISDASGSGLLDLNSECFKAEIMQLYGISELYTCLPEVALPHDICGYVTPKASDETGLKVGTPVCGGMFDITACAAAMNICDEKDICVITGTWSINEYISRTPAPVKGSVRNSLYCIPGYYLHEESSPTSAGNLEWYINTCMGDSLAGGNIYKHIDGMLENTPAEQSKVLFIPFLYGSNYRGVDKACFFNLQFQTTRADMLRAIFEGVVFSHMTHIDRLLNHRTKPRSIRLSGGAARSPVWTSMFADATGIPVEVVDTQEIGTLGCSMSAAIATGYYKDYTQAAHNMTNKPKLIIPDSNLHEIYMAKYIKYKEVLQKLS